MSKIQEDFINWKNKTKNKEKYEKLKREFSFAYYEALKKSVKTDIGVSSIVALQEDVFSDAWCEVADLKMDEDAELRSVVKPKVEKMMLMDDKFVEKILSSEKVDYYWEALEREWRKNVKDFDELNAKMHPLGPETNGDYKPNSSRLFDELSAVFMFPFGKDGASLKNVVYFGSDLGKFHSWMSKMGLMNDDVSFSETSLCLEDGMMKNIHCYRDRFSEVLKNGMFPVVSNSLVGKGSNPSLVYVDYDSGGNRITRETRDWIPLFDILYQCVSNLSAGTNVMVRLSGLDLEATKEMIALYGSMFEGFKLYYPMSKQFATMTPYLMLRSLKSEEKLQGFQIYLRNLREVIVQQFGEYYHSWRAYPTTFKSFFSTVEKRVLIKSMLYVNRLHKAIRGVYLWQAENVYLWEKRGGKHTLPLEVAEENRKAFDFLIDESRSFLISLSVQERLRLKKARSQSELVAKDFKETVESKLNKSDYYEIMDEDRIRSDAVQTVSVEKIAPNEYTVCFEGEDISQFPLLYSTELLGILFSLPRSEVENISSDTIINGKSVEDIFRTLRSKDDPKKRKPPDNRVDIVADYVQQYTQYRYWVYDHYLRGLGVDFSYGHSESLEFELKDQGYVEISPGFGNPLWYSKDGVKKTNCIDDMQCYWLKSSNLLQDFNYFESTKTLVFYFIDSIGYILKSASSRRIFKNWFEVLARNKRVVVAFVLLRDTDTFKNNVCTLTEDVFYNGKLCRRPNSEECVLRNSFDFVFSKEDLHDLFVKDWGWKLFICPFVFQRDKGSYDMMHVVIEPP